MGIKFKYEVSGVAAGVAAYAAGKGKAQERATKRTMDVWQDSQDKQARRDDLAQQRQFSKQQDEFRQGEYNKRQEAQFKYGQDMEEQRRTLDSEEDKRREIERRDAEIENDVQSGNLVETPGAKADIDKIRDALRKKLPELDEADKAAAIEAATARIREIRRYGTESPEPEAAPGQHGYNIVDGRPVKAGEGEGYNYIWRPGDDDLVPTEAYKGKQAAEAEQKKIAAEQAKQAEAARKEKLDWLDKRARELMGTTSTTTGELMYADYAAAHQAAVEQYDIGYGAEQASGDSGPAASGDSGPVMVDSGNVVRPNPGPDAEPAEGSNRERYGRGEPVIPQATTPEGAMEYRPDGPPAVSQPHVGNRPVTSVTPTPTGTDPAQLQPEPQLTPGQISRAQSPMGADREQPMTAEEMEAWASENVGGMPTTPEGTFDISSLDLSGRGTKPPPAPPTEAEWKAYRAVWGTPEERRDATGPGVTPAASESTEPLLSRYQKSLQRRQGKQQRMADAKALAGLPAGSVIIGEGRIKLPDGTIIGRKQGGR